MAEPAGRTILVINGRVLEVHPSFAVHRTDPNAGAVALGLLGGSLLALGISIAVGLGSFVAIGGVALFVAVGVVVGSERYELATALAGAGLIWTSAGIAIYLGNDPSLGLSALAFAVAGGLVLAAGRRHGCRIRRQGRS